MYWHLVGEELEARGHVVVAPDLPCDDDAAGLPEYADTVVARSVAISSSSGSRSARSPLSSYAVAWRAAARARRTDDSGSARGAGRSWADTRYGDEARESYDDTVSLFYQDVPPELAAEAVRRGRNQSEARLSEPAPFEEWPDVPTKVLLCRDDRLLPPSFVRRVARDRLGITPDEIDGGHTPALSRPKELADRLVAYAAEHGAA